jgi:hypothetical protein
MAEILRTPKERFEHLPGFDYAPHYPRGVVHTTELRGPYVSRYI